MANQQDDPSALIVPFGKHQGLTVAELLVRDPAYVEWLLGQSWLAQRFAKLHEAIITRGATADDTPEHNQIQARFLDPHFAAAAILASSPDRFENSRYEYPGEGTRYQDKLYDWRRDLLSWERWGKDAGRPHPGDEPTKPNPNPKPLVTTVGFEQAGIDVLIRWGFGEPQYKCDINIEIKPALGDDYPAVMRQMSRLGATVLVIDKYNSSTLNLNTVREMFKANRQILITLQEIFDQIPNAKIFMGNSA